MLALSYMCLLKTLLCFTLCSSTNVRLFQALFVREGNIFQRFPIKTFIKNVFHSYWYPCICITESTEGHLFVFRFYNAEAVLWAVGATALVSFALSVFAMQSKVRSMVLKLIKHNAEYWSCPDE